MSETLPLAYLLTCSNPLARILAKEFLEEELPSYLAPTIIKTGLEEQSILGLNPRYKIWFLHRNSNESVFNLKLFLEPCPRHGILNLVAFLNSESFLEEEYSLHTSTVLFYRAKNTRQENCKNIKSIFSILEENLKIGAKFYDIRELLKTYEFTK